MPEKLKESESKLEISLKANCQFVALEYTWAYEGELPARLRYEVGRGSNRVDRFVARSHTFMVSDGTAAEDGSVSVKGYYKVKDHPDWGWRTDIMPNGDSLRIVMYNVSPDSDEETAVKTDFRRI